MCSHQRKKEDKLEKNTKNIGTTRSTQGPENRHRSTGNAWTKPDEPTRSEGAAQA